MKCVAVSLTLDTAQCSLTWPRRTCRRRRSWAPAKGNFVFWRLLTVCLQLNIWFTIIILTCGCLFLRIVVHSLLLCSGLTWFTALAATAVAPLPVDDNEPAGTGVILGRVKVPLVGCVGMKAVELCNRVLTTSNGQVTMAPTVPAVLEDNYNKIII